MSEFKYACPVCGQHISCDASQAGSVMECPTCFQKITVPQAPTEGDQKFIITGTKVGDRHAPSGADVSPRTLSPSSKSFPGAIIVGVILIFIGVAVAFVYRGTIFKSSKPTNPSSSIVQTRAAPSQPLPTGVVQTNLPSSLRTNYWTMDIDAVDTPDVPVGGKIHGKLFTAERIILNSDGLTIRTRDVPPDAGITVYLQPKPIESVFGKTIVIKPDTVNAPLLNLRWKDAQGHGMQQPAVGYALRIEFGQPNGNQLPGKIYLCTPDATKSYVAGTFTVEVRRPRRQ